MAHFLSNTNYQHGSTPTTGILLVNLGSPSLPTTASVRHYLAEFLSDSRMIEIPKPIWWCILHGLILRTRPKQSAKAYHSIWLEQGAPLTVYTNNIAQKLQVTFDEAYPTQNFKVYSAMRYGDQSIANAIATCMKDNVTRLCVLPLFPQYSAATTASVFDTLADVLKQYRYIPELRFINHYADFTGYIKAIAACIQHNYEQHSPGELLLFSYHGLPKRNLLLGDPYYCLCQKTSRLIANLLNLNPNQYRVVFQSRFGKAEWLKPYCEDTLIELAKAGYKKIDIICPGFATDCLETLEEIAIRYQESFIKAGGLALHYIPALNDSSLQIQLIRDLIALRCHDWFNQVNITGENQLQRQQALKLGAIS